VDVWGVISLAECVKPQETVYYAPPCKFWFLPLSDRTVDCILICVRVVGLASVDCGHTMTMIGT
jgi:hypothetical protein